MERFGPLGNLPVTMDQIQRWSSLTGWSTPIKNYPSICETNLSNRKWTLRSGSKLRALSIQPKLLAGIFGNLQWRMEQHFHLFSKKFSRKFSFHSTLLLEVLEFSVEWFAFRKFKSFREISEPFAAVSKFWKVLVEWQAPLGSIQLCYSIYDRSVWPSGKLLDSQGIDKHHGAAIK